MLISDCAFTPPFLFSALFFLMAHELMRWQCRCTCFDFLSLFSPFSIFFADYRRFRFLRFIASDFLMLSC